MPVMIPLVARDARLDRLPQHRDRLAERRSSGSSACPQPDWINSEIWIYPALSIIGLWAIGNFMLINIAGLQSVPTELYEAARIDGAGAWTQFRQITIPLMSPVLLYNLVIVLDRDVPVLHPGLRADQRPGRPEQRDAVHQPRCCSAKAFVVQPDGLRRRRSPGCCSRIVLVLTLAIFGFARKRVYYAGGER